MPDVSCAFHYPNLTPLCRARAANAAAPPAGTATAEQLARLRALVTSMGANTGATRASAPALASSAAAATASDPGESAYDPSPILHLMCTDDELALSDILTPDNLIPLFTSHPTLLPALFPHLPPDLLPSAISTTPTPQQTAQLTETLQRTIHSPPFRTAVAQLDRALQTGQLGGFVRSLGLPPSAGTSVGAFLRAIVEQARRDDEGAGGSDTIGCFKVESDYKTNKTNSSQNNCISSADWIGLDEQPAVGSA